MDDPLELKKQFIQFSIQNQVLRFGEFITKAGRVSPYFFDTGLFCDGESVATLAQFYLKTMLMAKIDCDLLFGPAYKGIVLAALTAAAMAQHGKKLGFAYNRKEIKDHGEGGSVVGAPLHGRILIIDDVISAGTSVGESLQYIRAAGAHAVGVLVALDRMERGSATLSATDAIKQDYKIPVFSIASLSDVVAFLKTQPRFAAELARIIAYREQYGVSNGGALA